MTDRGRDQAEDVVVGDQAGIGLGQVLGQGAGSPFDPVEVGLKRPRGSFWTVPEAPEDGPGLPVGVEGHDDGQGTEQQQAGPEGEGES